MAANSETNMAISATDSCSKEMKRCRQRSDGLREQAVHEVNCALHVQMTTASVVQGLAVHHHGGIRALKRWELFFLVRRMLLYRPPRGGLVPCATLQERVARFAVGDWVTWQSCPWTQQ